MNSAQYWFSRPSPTKRSVRFTNTDFFSRASSGYTGQTYTLSFWYKQSHPQNSKNCLVSFGHDGTNDGTGLNLINVVTTDADLPVGLAYTPTTAGSKNVTLGTYSDVSNWYNVIYTSDLANNITKIYINGVERASYAGATAAWGSGKLVIGGDPAIWADQNFYGFMTEVNFVDGQVLDPTEFGAFNDLGTWSFRDPQISEYGAAGFRLEFEDVDDLGFDSSTKGNDFTVEGDPLSSVDHPEINYASLESWRDNSTNFNEPLIATSGNDLDFESGVVGTIALPDTGAYYYEVTVIDAASIYIGVIDSLTGTRQFFYEKDGDVHVGNGNVVDSKAAIVDGDIIGVAIDADQQTFNFYRNGAVISDTDYSYAALEFETLLVGFGQAATTGGAKAAVNFGQVTFDSQPDFYDAYSRVTSPRTTIDKGSSQVDPITAGGSDILSLSTEAFSGLYLIKDRESSGVTPWKLVDSLRESSGTYQQLEFPGDPNPTPESTYAAPAGNSVSYCWRCEDDFTPTGGVNPVGKRNETSGFSMIRTGGSADAYSIGHGLTQAPELVLHKGITTGTALWCFHRNIGGTGAVRWDGDDPVNTNVGFWNSTEPDETNIYFGAGLTLADEEYVTYAWHSVEGYSKFGAFRGSDIFHVNTGFRPAIVIYKNIDTNSDWYVFDSSRSPYNDSMSALKLNVADDEESTNMNFYSNGFGGYITTTNTHNTSGTYIYIAFAETPFKFAKAR